MFLVKSLHYLPRDSLGVLTNNTDGQDYTPDLYLDRNLRSLNLKTDLSPW